MSADFTRKVTTLGDVHVVRLQGELDLDTAEGLPEWLIEISGSTVVLDLSGLSFMDSSGISAIVQARIELGDNLVLSRPQPNVQRVLEITGLESWISDWNSDWVDAEG
jgi:anti-sigma B factor antagonist